MQGLLVLAITYTNNDNCYSMFCTIINNNNNEYVEEMKEMLCVCIACSCNYDSCNYYKIKIQKQNWTPLRQTTCSCTVATVNLNKLTYIIAIFVFILIE